MKFSRGFIRFVVSVLAVLVLGMTMSVYGQEMPDETDPEKFQDLPTRYFKEIKNHRKGHSGAHFGLACFDCNGAFSRMYEVSEMGEVLSDTMLVWTQHYSEGDSILYEEAQRADMIISCYPNHIQNKSFVNKHVYPEHDNIVYLEFFNNNMVMVTASDSSYYKYRMKQLEAEN